MIFDEIGITGCGSLPSLLGSEAFSIQAKSPAVLLLFKLNGIGGIQYAINNYLTLADFC
jgi:hypothetical protein